MAATELALNNPLIDEYTLQGAKGLLVNITGGSDIKLFEVDAAVNKIRAEVDPEAELIFGAIKDENMNGKIRVSIVATSLRGSLTNHEPKPKFNVVNGINGRNSNFSDNLFSKNNIEQNVVGSIDGATALKLDESFEIKDSEEQNTLIESFESNEENNITNEIPMRNEFSDDIPNGVSIESASYIENNNDLKVDNFNPEQSREIKESLEEEYTPKLFSDELNHANQADEISKEEDKTEELFDRENNEDEDFEIPAFLRRQKF